jgi:threonine/homoserine/homoserine lactone efflux protein
MSPGPSLAVVTRCTLQGGLGHGLAAALAHGAGVALYGLFTVTGLAVLIARSPAVFLAIQLAGAAYLLYLGIGALRSRPQQAGENADHGAAVGGQSAAASGFLVAFLNPKLAVFMLALFSQFLQPGAGWGARSIMVATVGITDALWYSLIAGLLSRPRFLQRLQRSAGPIDRLFGALLILLALTVVARALGLFDG